MIILNKDNMTEASYVSAVIFLLARHLIFGINLIWPPKQQQQKQQPQPKNEQQIRKDEQNLLFSKFFAISVSSFQIIIFRLYVYFSVPIDIIIAEF